MHLGTKLYFLLLALMLLRPAASIRRLGREMEEVSAEAETGSDDQYSYDDENEYYDDSGSDDEDYTPGESDEEEDESSTDEKLANLNVDLDTSNDPPIQKNLAGFLVENLELEQKVAFPPSTKPSLKPYQEAVSPAPSKPCPSEAKGLDQLTNRQLSKSIISGEWPSLPLINRIIEALVKEMAAKGGYEEEIYLKLAGTAGNIKKFTDNLESVFMANWAHLVQDTREFVEIFKDLIGERVLPSSVKHFFESLNMKLAFPAIAGDLLNALCRCDDLEYFLDIFMAICEYFDWTMVYYYLRGPKLYDYQITNEQLFTTRLVLAILSNDVQTVRFFMTNFMEKIGYVNLKKSLYTIANRSKRFLPRIKDMPSILQELYQIPDADHVFPPLLLAELFTSYVDNMSTRAQTGLRDALAKIDALDKSRPNTTLPGVQFRPLNQAGLANALFAHLADPRVSTAETIPGFVRSMIDDSVPERYLEDYLIGIDVPPEIPRIKHQICDNLNRITDYRKLISLLHIIGQVSKVDYQEMLQNVENSQLEVPRKICAMVHFAFRAGDIKLLRIWLDQMKKWIKHEKKIKLLEGLHETLLLSKRDRHRPKMIAIVKEARLLELPQVKRFIQRASKEMMLLNEVLTPTAPTTSKPSTPTAKPKLQVGTTKRKRSSFAEQPARTNRKGGIIENAKKPAKELPKKSAKWRRLTSKLDAEGVRPVSGLNKSSQLPVGQDKSFNGPEKARISANRKRPNRFLKADRNQEKIKGSDKRTGKTMRIVETGMAD